MLLSGSNRFLPFSVFYKLLQGAECILCEASQRDFGKFAFFLLKGENGQYFNRHEYEAR